MLSNTCCYRLLYAMAVYDGVYNRINDAIVNNNEDRREELQYLVDRYCKEEIISGAYLRKELDKYNEIADEKFGKIESEVD